VSALAFLSLLFQIETMSQDPKKQLVVVDGVRTPFAKMGTALANCDAVELGRVAVSALLTQTGIDPEIIDETIFGCVSQPADAANIARVVALRSGIPERVPAVTVHRNCGSGLEAIATASDKMAAGRGEVFIVGGTESMSRVPLLYSPSAAKKFTTLSRAKTFGAKASAMMQFRPSDFAPIVALRLGLTDPVVSMNMGQTAELIARDYDISRAEQDRFAFESNAKALAAAERLREEMCPVYLPESRGKDDFVIGDNGPREGQTIEALAKLRPVFEKDTGTVTAGNSSQITDGAVALLVMTSKRAEALGLEPLGRLVNYAFSGCDPKRMGLGPADAIRDLAERTGRSPGDADVVEINEAFAAQVLGVLKCLEGEQFKGCELDPEKLNPNGGAIALGHPVGASGARIVLTALHELKRRGTRQALVSLCIGGGQGGAAWLERT